MGSRYVPWYEVISLDGTHYPSYAECSDLTTVQFYLTAILWKVQSCAASTYLTATHFDVK